MNDDNKRRLKVRLKNPYSLFSFDGRKKELVLKKSAGLDCLRAPQVGESKTLDLFKYVDRDRTIHVYLLEVESARTVVATISLKDGSPGARSVRELVKNRKLGGTEYDLAEMMCELFAYRYRRRHGEHAAAPCEEDDYGFFNWDVPAIDLGEPRTIIFSDQDITYLTGCYDQALDQYLLDELDTLARAVSLGYQCHVAMCEFFDSFVKSCRIAAERSTRYFSQVDPAPDVATAIDRAVSQDLFANMNEAFALMAKARRHEDRAEELLWKAKMEEAGYGNDHFH